MSGIDKIIRQIEEDTKSYCDEVLENARTKADRTIKAAEDEAARIKAASEAKTQDTLADIAARARSSASLEEKKTILCTKQSVIAEMLRTALENAKSLPEDEYFSLILKMIKKNSLPHSGIISFGKKDLDRMPKGFEAQINDVSEGSLALSKEPIDIDAGFVLSYGGIEENCSFDAVCLSKSENLSDKASALLF